MQQLTYENLIAIQRDIEHQCRISPAFSFFNAEKIRRFMQRNAIRLNIANQKLNEMFDAYVKKDEAGKWKQIVEEGKPAKWDFHDEESEKSFNEKYADLMSITIDIHL